MRTTGSKTVFALGTSALTLCPDSGDLLQTKALDIKSKQPPEKCPLRDVSLWSTLCTSLGNTQLFLSCHCWFWSGLLGLFIGRKWASGSIKLTKWGRCTNLCKNNAGSWQSGNKTKTHVHWSIKCTKKKGGEGEGPRLLNGSDYNTAACSACLYSPTAHIGQHRCCTCCSSYSFDWGFEYFPCYVEELCVLWWPSTTSVFIQHTAR